MATQAKVLVTGGAGYIGSVLTRKLLAAGYHVTVLDNMTYTDIGLRQLYQSPNLIVVRGDIREKADIENAVKGVDSLIHLAAIANDPSGELDPEVTRSTNLRSYPLLLKLARDSGVKRFINASTFSVYGVSDVPNLTEEMPLHPLKEYSICKAKAEEIVAEYNSRDFTTTSLRCATVCGWSPRMRFDLIVNTLTAHAIVNKKITVMGGNQQRPQIHIQDLTDYFVAMLEAPASIIGGQVFNAGAENASISSIADEIRASLDESIQIEIVPPRSDERSYHVSSEKLQRSLGLAPKRGIRNAVDEIANAYSAHLWTNPDDAIYNNVRRMTELLAQKQVLAR
jgi:nucleoside-diphosphate-sugar epimerase